MKKQVYMPIVGVVVALALFVGCGGRSGEKEYSKAIEAWKDGEVVRAKSLLEKAIRKMSGNEKKSVALNQLGLVYWELGEPAEAAEAFNKSRGLTDDVTGANLNLGVALYHAGQYDEAEVALNNVLGEDPRNETALALLGMTRVHKRDWKAAATELNKAASVNPRDPAAQNALALAELHQGNNSDQAIRRLQAVASAHPSYAAAAFNLGSVYEFYKKDRNAALSWYQQYLKKAGPDGSHVDAAKLAVSRLGGSAPGGSAVAPRHDTQAAARYLAAASKLHGQKKYAEAVEQYKKAIAADPTQKDAHYYMAHAYYSDGKYEDALMACENTLNLDPNHAKAQDILTLSYCKLRRWNDAERAAKDLKKLDSARGEQMIKYIASERKR